MDFTWLDYIIILIFFLNIAMGAVRGLLREIVSAISLIIAIVIAIKFTVTISDFLITSQGFFSVVSLVSSYSKYNATLPLSYLTFGSVFLLLSLGTFYVGEAVNYYAVNTGMFAFFPTLIIVERILSTILGFIRGYVFNLILILILGMSPVVKDPAWTSSVFVPKLMPMASQLGASVRPGGFPVWS